MRVFEFYSRRIFEKIQIWQRLTLTFWHWITPKCLLTCHVVMFHCHRCQIVVKSFLCVGGVYKRIDVCKILKYSLFIVKYFYTRKYFRLFGEVYIFYKNRRLLGFTSIYYLTSVIIIIKIIGLKHFCN